MDIEISIGQKGFQNIVTNKFGKDRLTVIYKRRYAFIDEKNKDSKNSLFFIALRN